MRVVLLQNVDKVGRIGDTKDVAEGYARNFLIPRGLAVFPDDVRANQALAKRQTSSQKQRVVSVPKISRREKRLSRQEKEKEQLLAKKNRLN